MNHYENFATLVGAIILNSPESLPNVGEDALAVEEGQIGEWTVELIPHLHRTDPVWLCDLMKKLLYSSHFVFGIGAAMKSLSAYAVIDLDSAWFLANKLLNSANPNDRCASMCILPGMCYIDKKRSRYLIKKGMNDESESVKRYVIRCLPCIAETDPEYFDFIEAKITKSPELHRLLYSYVLAYGARDHWDRLRKKGKYKSLFGNKGTKEQFEALWTTFSNDIAITVTNDNFLFLLPRWNGMYAFCSINPQIGFERLRNMFSKNNEKGLKHASISLPYLTERLGELDIFIDKFPHSDIIIGQALLCHLAMTSEDIKSFIIKYQSTISNLEFTDLVSKCIREIWGF